MKAFLIVIGIIVTVAVFTVITVLIIKGLSKFYNSMADFDEKNIQSEKKLWLRAIYYLISEDYETITTVR